MLYPLSYEGGGCTKGGGKPLGPAAKCSCHASGWIGGRRSAWATAGACSSGGWAAPPLPSGGERGGAGVAGQGEGAGHEGVSGVK